MRISDWSSDVCSSDVVRQAEHSDSALEAGGLQDDVVAADPRQRTREAAVVAGELEAAPRVVGAVLREDRVEAAEVAGGERIPFPRVAAGLLPARLQGPGIVLWAPETGGEHGGS